MIRFCDREVASVEYDKIEKQEVLRFFKDGHIDDFVCIFDSEGLYVGYITYLSILNNIDINNAILREYVVFDRDFWKNARRFWRFQDANCKECKLLPVVNEERRLICFAYEDIDANRELRMLRELQGETGALQFSDVYPEICYVKIYEFNELAYFFAKYLETQGISVQTCGAMWSIYPDCVGGGYSAASFLDYKGLTIYAEGTQGKSANWMENLLRSVSVEFECIDIIYEKNIEKGIIKDAEGDCRTLISRLKDMEIAILGVDIEAQEAYDYLLQQEIEVKCFVDDVHEVNEAGKERLFCKPVLSLRNILSNSSSDTVFIDNHEKNSAWGCGCLGADYFDYQGYERNKRYFVLKDYNQIRGNGIKNVLRKQREIVLIGDVGLCEYLMEYLENGLCFLDQIWYLILPGEPLYESNRLKVIRPEALKKDALYLIVLPEYTYKYEECVTKKKQILAYLTANGCLNYSDYFSYAIPYIDIENERESKYPHEDLKIKRIALGSIETCSGSFFVRDLFDNHPFIMMMEYGYLNSNLFWFCIRLAGKGVDEIVCLFEQLYSSECDTESLESKKFFMTNFRIEISQLLVEGEVYTPQELFVAFHIAYMHVYSKPLEDVANCIIYWEPHNVSRYIIEWCVEWLGTRELPCEIINVVRNNWISKGSFMKGILELGWGRGDKSRIYKIALDVYDLPEENNIWERLTVKFEDLKCNSREELEKICKKWEIPWSDSLLTTTRRGTESIYNNGKEEIKNFDITPVFNNYEEYFSEFDRFRISLISSPWQKKYGYPYADISLFSRKDLQEMFLIEFRFAKRVGFEDEEKKLAFHIELQHFIRRSLQKVRRHRLLEDMEWQPGSR